MYISSNLPEEIVGKGKGKTILVEAQRFPEV
jgi:hypothetical protein